MPPHQPRCYGTDMGAEWGPAQAPGILLVCKVHHIKASELLGEAVSSNILFKEHLQTGK